MPRLRSALLLLFILGTFSAAVAWQKDAAPPDDGKQVLPVLRQQGPRYWKGNLHTHSLWSDGDDFPEMIADWYKRHSYDFLALTDHNVLADGEFWIDSTSRPKLTPKALEKYRARFGDHWVEQRTKQDKDKEKAQVRLKPLAEYRSLLEEPGRFLLLPAEEISHRYAKAPIHINAINLRDAIKPVDGDSIAETIRVNHRLVAEQQKRTGWRMIAFLNHPNFQWGIRAEDMILAEEMRYFEVFNGHPGVRNHGDELHPSCERLWDIVLALRLGKLRLPVVYGLGTDDAHAYHAFGVGKVNPGRAWIMVQAPYLSAEAIVQAIQAGDFYASTGVTLREVRRTGGELAVQIQAEPGVTYRTQFIAAWKDASLSSTPRRGKDDKPLDVSHIYSDEIGRVVAEVEGTNPSYRLTGREWYVRAKIISSKPHPNPYEKGDVEVAWTQPAVP